ncbi:MAG: mechanosensitive ion channel [Bacteroidetes bacterium]|jgi:small conductance mechanosensitive channel|nr:mechanosensitive ion channel [Bacteroidota bacterium]
MENLITPEFWNELAINFKNWLLNVLPEILITLIVLFITLRIFRFLMNKSKAVILKRLKEGAAGDEMETEKRVNTLLGIIRGAGAITIWMVFLIILLSKLGLDIGPLLAGAGILGLAIGFGSQDLVRDFISGFFILLENQIRTGDVAIINGTGGLVEKIEMRTTTLRDFSGVVHIFQNGKINTMSNMTKEWSAIVFDIGVAYKEDTDKVSQIMKDVGQQMLDDAEFKEKIIEPIEVVGVDSFGDSAVIIKARLKTKPIMQWAVGREYRRRLKKAFDQQGIEIPFPHISVYWGEKINPLRLEMEELQKK